MERLLATLERVWCGVTVRNGPVTEWAQRATLAASPHGKLTVLNPRFRRLMEQAIGDHHAIVLVGATERSILYLDPWYAAPGQPIHADIDEFVKFGWTGDVFVLS